MLSRGGGGVQVTSLESPSFQVSVGYGHDITPKTIK